ncbi:hypothetical protein Q2K19_12160 [Micromonospora soli]|uniref:hypothetical protein n=1 Tax=Micromonospora sp. NBRC 110009 TaxID=3061627 RepID=UPI0026733DE7|nr:hypothetical protein [Micromonospora sp. NBRC 110009]WKU01164.1 hypothetical protein Q2K19_12160 [Micromonospora sp. NBRC 110009]
MDEKTYAAVTEVCARLAGRLSDDTLGAVRDQYAAGEWDLADATLLLNLAYEHVGITAEEHDLIRSFLGDPDSPDLRNVPVVAELSSPPYRFSSTGPATAPDPSRADSLLSAEAPRHGGQRLRRAWRDSFDGAPNGPTWVYVLPVAEGTDELKAHSGLTSSLWTSLQEKWPVEVVAEDTVPPAYQAAALAAGYPVWTA